VSWPSPEARTGRESSLERDLRAEQSVDGASATGFVAVDRTHHGHFGVAGSARRDFHTITRSPGFINGRVTGWDKK